MDLRSLIEGAFWARKKMPSRVLLRLPICIFHTLTYTMS
jgi:hypothetical protein